MMEFFNEYEVVDGDLVGVSESVKGRFGEWEIDDFVEMEGLEKSTMVEKYIVMEVMGDAIMIREWRGDRVFRAKKTSVKKLWK